MANTGTSSTTPAGWTFTGPTVGALDGNAAANRTGLTNSIGGLGIANGATFWFRWTDFNATSSDDGLSVDDFSLTAARVTRAPARACA